MKHRRVTEGTGAPLALRRPAALAVTAGLHVLLAALFLLRQPERPQPPPANWIDMIRVEPARQQAVPAAAAPLGKPLAARLRRARPATATPPPAPAQEPVTELVFPAAPVAKPGAFELARAAAGDVDKELRKQFPERALLRSSPRAAQQKLAEGIASAIAPPKFYEPARISVIQDQGVGWGRRVEKVQTAFGTYCITHESNHGGDGRDVFKDALKPKIRSCPREK